ncbi:NUDIX hydrolase N-terminal domain-containing protein [Clostridium paraputrificum]|uniref:NUDIX hydrolase N-terminal domain-containing protein n=1 Tax=Clostridium paraputrificum TaxID=29363 RepID=UPI00311AA0B9
MKDHLVDIAIELQSIAQAGLEYSKDKFDIERFQRIREISAEIMSKKSELSLDKVKDLFCNETGYQTSKVDTRAAIFKNNKILLKKYLKKQD